MVARHPRIHFQCFLASAHANQTLCTLARELPNFSLAGYWWHNFFPTFIERVFSERLDMLSTSRQVGFFSDAYTMEWSYAKAVIVRRVMAKVLAEKIAAGQYTCEGALEIARQLVYESPHRLLGLEPASLSTGRASKGRSHAGAGRDRAPARRGSMRRGDKSADYRGGTKG
jgi:glucuronate isomerase